MLIQGGALSTSADDLFPKADWKRFQEHIIYAVYQSPFPKEVLEAVTGTAETVCRMQNFSGYLEAALPKIDHIFVLMNPSGNILAFALVLTRLDIPVALLSLICSVKATPKRGKRPYYGILLHGFLAHTLVSLGIEEMVLSSTVSNVGYYRYLGYTIANGITCDGRILLESVDGTPMVLCDIPNSKLMDLTEEKFYEALNYYKPSINGIRKNSTGWRTITDFYTQVLTSKPLTAANRSSALADLSKNQRPIPDVSRLTGTGDYMLHFEFEGDYGTNVCAAVIAKLHTSKLAELTVVLEHEFSFSDDYEGRIGLANILVLLMLRGLQKRGVEQVVLTEDDYFGEFLSIGFVVGYQNPKIIVPTTRRYLMADLENIDLVENTTMEINRCAALINKYQENIEDKEELLYE